MVVTAALGSASSKNIEQDIFLSAFIYLVYLILTKLLCVGTVIPTL